MVSVNNKYLIRDIENAIKFYPLLKLIDKKGRPTIVSGEIPLIHPNYGEFDRYSIWVSFTDNYPKRFPIVVETSNKIPKIPDRHINIDNTLCLAVLPEELKIAKNGISFKFFLDKVLVPHLSRETYYSMEKEYPSGEYEHGSDGIWKYFEEILNVSDKLLIIKELQKIEETKQLKRNEKCYCESGKNFKKCHLKKWDKVLEMGRNNLKLIIGDLKKEIATA